MQTSKQSPQHTLWLWTEGAFARRIVYYLLIKGLVSSPAALLEGKTTEANLQVNVIKLDPQTGGWICTNNPSDPQPQGASNPCMRTACMETKTSTLIHESNSILLYLEELYPANSDQRPALKGDTLLLTAKTADLLAQINLLGMNTNYFLRNTITVHGNVMGHFAFGSESHRGFECETLGNTNSPQDPGLGNHPQRFPRPRQIWWMAYTMYLRKPGSS